jgi:capsular polysaccharide biosynthesis protein
MISKLSIDETIAHFNESALLIGAHGGLAFMAWLPSNSSVVEIGHMERISLKMIFHHMVADWVSIT